MSRPRLFGAAVLSVVAVFCTAPAAFAVTELIPNDTFWSKEWYMRQVHAPEAWAVTTGTPSVLVAMIDGGVDITHPDLRDNIWTNPGEIPDDGIDNDNDGYIDDVHGWNFVTRSGDVRPVRINHQIEEAWSHGTLTTSLLAAKGNDGHGIAGMDWNAKVMPLVGLDGEGNGSTEDIIQAIHYAIAHHARVINLSLVGYDYDAPLEQAVQEAAAADIVVVAATGNEDEIKAGVNLDEVPAYPVCFDGTSDVVIGVSGTDTLDQKAPYANYGSACTDVSAPAQQLFAARPSYPHDTKPTSTVPGFLDDVTGTSLASPIVAGVAALIRSVRPEWTAAEVRNRILQTADPIENLLTPEQKGKMGRGRLNAGRALAGLGAAPAAGAVSMTTVVLEHSLPVLRRDNGDGSTSSTPISVNGSGPWKVEQLTAPTGDLVLLTSVRSASIILVDLSTGTSKTLTPYGKKVRGVQALSLPQDQGWLLLPSYGGGQAMVLGFDGRVRSAAFPFGKKLVGTWKMTMNGERILVTGPRGLHELRDRRASDWQAL